jgi:hypothetical protein
MCDNLDKGLNEQGEPLSKVQLEWLTLLYTLQYSKKMFAENEANTAASQELQLGISNNQLKVSDLHVMINKLSMSPHKVYGADISYCASEKQYICRLPPVYDAEEEELVSTDIFAYGDTPAAAVDNFDAMWVYGNQNPTNGGEDV